jgi:hypothetical protein
VRGFRVASMAAVALSLAILPVGDAALSLVLLLALDGAALALLARRARPAPRGAAAVATLGGAANVTLFRRTAPELRSRRPVAIIEAQIAWRQAAERRRQRGGLVGRPGRS